MQSKKTKQGTDNSIPAAGRPVSIGDVARAASVSVATVSRVLNSPERVAPSTAERVQRIIEELEYRPNHFAKGLITRRSHLLAIVLPDLSGEFYSELMTGADEAARSLGYHLLVNSTGRRSASEGGDEILGVGLLDGFVLLLTEPDEAALERAANLGRPVVIVEADARSQGLDSVLVDNTSGARAAAEHLLSATAPDACYFVGGPPQNHDSVERANAFTAALERQGHAARPDQVVFGDYGVAWGERWLQHRAAAGSASSIAVLAGNDEIAYGILSAAAREGIDVPTELRLVGFDNSGLSLLTRPKLSSVRLPATEVGAAAVEMLIRRIQQPDAAPSYVMLPTEFVPRESSAP
ncbi:MAG: LacI family DNA-binding transcriptional regulator [Planctomycetota bacterium]